MPFLSAGGGGVADQVVLLVVLMCIQRTAAAGSRRMAGLRADKTSDVVGPGERRLGWNR